MRLRKHQFKPIENRFVWGNENFVNNFTPEEQLEAAASLAMMVIPMGSAAKLYSYFRKFKKVDDVVDNADEVKQALNAASNKAENVSEATDKITKRSTRFRKNSYRLLG
ncbi:hypothetical protein KDD30_15345 [Photobacterium sp. GJ3]|uniref:hypothetical protein n=1 Tax=Photobacterium sp. GJ3 TaxID=2829502 RepID=UPI001B8C49F0|nr:hypothetical protein [Photobacterium sp. GJ3]QUJ67389.1 hypothetical protein KDD30_15345 [Photobacterium sp. GJ3]